MTELAGQQSRPESANLLALDWEAMGRLVRRGTLEAVGQHFAEIAAREDGVTGGDAIEMKIVRTR